MANRSERNVVFEIRAGGGRSRGTLITGTAATLGFGQLVVAFETTATGVAAARTSLAVQHLHFVRHNFGGVTIMAILVLPLSGTQSALNIDFGAFLQVFAGNFPQLVEEHHSVPLGALLHLAAVLVFPGFAGSNGD